MKLPVLTLALSAVAVLCAPMADSLQNALTWTPQALPAGEWWVLLSAHLLHWTGSHLWWDVLAFCALGMWCEMNARLATWLTIGLAAVAILLLIPWTNPELLSYRGLSGLASALVGLAAARSWLGKDPWERGLFTLLVLGLIAKSIWEYRTGSCLFAETGPYKPVPAAHLIGALIGLLVGLTCRTKAAQENTREDEALPRAEVQSRAQ